MNDRDIQVFIKGVQRYFESLTKDVMVFIEPPFIKDEVKPFLEYTGIIGISGRERGAVCFTANGVMLERILSLLNEAPINRNLICDLVGEIANTLSGNAREEFGKDFLISVPVVSTGQNVHFQFPPDGRNYVIPIIWQGERAYLLVCLT